MVTQLATGRSGRQLQHRALQCLRTANITLLALCRKHLLASNGMRQMNWNMDSEVLEVRMDSEAEFSTCAGQH